jgi:hypothetical protein
MRTRNARRYHAQVDTMRDASPASSTGSRRRRTASRKPVRNGTQTGVRMRRFPLGIALAPVERGCQAVHTLHRHDGAECG